MKFVPLVVLAFIAGEIAGFILVGQRVGVLATLGLLFLSFVAGAALVRSTGLAMGQVMRRRPASAQAAAEIATTATFRMLAGVLLIVPGFLTDVAAGVLLIPAVQSYLRRRLSGTFNGASAQWPADTPRAGPIIEGEAVQIEGVITHRPDDPRP